VEGDGDEEGNNGAYGFRRDTIDRDGIGGFKVEKHDRQKEVRFARRLRVVLLNIELQQRRMRVALIDGSKAHIR
jgi:hypothetical protein